ncbi:hypothetical protein NX059_004370 [Plenodomus lindquistii]|nr:hypothetical protein NX059_004370 [Plenodomus lindquistii]
MKYALVFAATAAASYDAYGSYPENAKSSSSDVKSMTSSKPIGYTTIYPGYGKDPVTVTTQHQPYPTCVSAGYGGKDCDKWEDDKYVSTTVKDYDSKTVTVTKVKQPVTVYHTKKTITHSATGKNGNPTSSAGYAQPTGSAYKNGTDGCWYELYEKIEEVPYNKLGPHALPGYPGSGLYPEGDKKQPVHVKELKGGKWSEYEHTYSYGKPEDEVTTYEKPGVYTVPAKDVTVDYPVAHPAEATKTAHAGETLTYGGQYIDAKETGYVTGAYGAYETKYDGGKTVTETVVKYTTIWVTATGKVEVTKPTTTVCDKDTEVAYPTAKTYAPGVYHHDAKTVTVTKGGEAYTCKYEQTEKYDPTPKDDKHVWAYPTGTSAKGDDYGYKASATASKPAGDDKYPVNSGYPSKGSEHASSSVYDNKYTSSAASASSVHSVEVTPSASSVHSVEVTPSASSVHSVEVTPSASSVHSVEVTPSASSVHSVEVTPSASSVHSVEVTPSASKEHSVEVTPSASIEHSVEVTPSASYVHPEPTPSTTPELPTGGVSHDGMCGDDHNGRTCTGSVFGSCCSMYGYCGNSNDHCGYGCQSDSGLCGTEHADPTTEEPTTEEPTNEEPTTEEPTTEEPTTEEPTTEEPTTEEPTTEEPTTEEPTTEEPTTEEPTTEEPTTEEPTTEEPTTEEPTTEEPTTEEPTTEEPTTEEPTTEEPTTEQPPSGPGSQGPRPNRGQPGRQPGRQRRGRRFAA